MRPDQWRQVEKIYLETGAENFIESAAVEVAAGMLVSDRLRSF